MKKVSRGPATKHVSKLDDDTLKKEFLDALLATKGVAKACKKVGVGAATFFRYIGREENREFRTAVDTCREAIADVLFDECVTIADETDKDQLKDDRGRPIPNQAAIARDRLRIDTRIRVAGKLRPKKYGDQPQVQVGVNVGNVLCDEETRHQIAEMRSRLMGQRREKIVDAKLIDDKTPDHAEGQLPGEAGDGN